MDSSLLGITVLGGDTRVRTHGQLIRLDQLSGTGPQGEQGEQGETGPAGATGAQGPQGATGAGGEDGTVDTSTFYKKASGCFADDEHSEYWNIPGSRC